MNEQELLILIRRLIDHGPYLAYGEEDACIYCGRYEGWDHEDDCPYPAALAALNLLEAPNPNRPPRPTAAAE
jgi:hypothetical protein